MKKLMVTGLVALGLTLAGCSSDDDDDDSGMDTTALPAATPGVGNSVYDNIVNDPNLSTLLAAIDAAGLADTLDNEETPFTVFAPNNAAFQVLEDSDPNDNAIEDLLADPTTLSSILTYHVISGTTVAADAAAASPADLTTVNGAALALAGSDTAPTGLSVGGADILVADSNYSETASVGVVHVIRSVLIPPQ